MASYIDWYLIELERRLTGRMNEEGVFTFLSEVEDHLRLKADDLVAAGMDTNKAEKVATQSFGDLNEIAVEAVARLEPQRMARGKVYVTVSVLSIWLCIVVVSICGFIPELVIGLFALTFLAGVFFLVGSAMANRRQWRSIALIGCGGTVAATSLMPLGFRPVGRERLESVYWLKNDLTYESQSELEVQTSIGVLKKGVAYYHQLEANHGDLTKMTLMAPRTRDGKFSLPERDYYSNGPGFYYYYGDRAYSSYGYSGSTTDLTLAKTEWLGNGQSMLDELQNQTSYRERRLADLREAARMPPHFSITYLDHGLVIGASVSALFLGLNAGVMGLARQTRRRRISRPVVA